MLSFQPFVQQNNLGALNLCSEHKQAFDDSQHVGLLFASHAAVATSGAQQQEHLHKAIVARDVIGHVMLAAAVAVPGDGRHGASFPEPGYRSVEDVKVRRT
jgi:hypothetical protein